MERIKTIINKPIDGERIYLFTMAFYILVLFLRNTTFDPYLGSRFFNISSYFVILLLLFKFYFLDDLPKRKKIILSFIIILAIVSWKNSNSNLILAMISFIVAAHGVLFKKILKIYFGTVSIILISVMFFSLTGIIKNLIFEVPGRATRYSLGIIYPTDLAAHVLYLMLVHEYLNFKKLNWKYYGSYLAIAIITKFITDARLSVLCMILSVIVISITRYAKRNNSIILKKIISTFWMYIPISAFIAFVSTYFFDKNNHIFFAVDRMLSGRLGYGHLAMGLYPIKWFGQNIVEHGLGGNSGMSIFNNHNNGYFFIDSSYIRLILIYGLIMTFIILGIMVIISVEGLESKKYELTVILLIVTLSCLVEQHLLELSFNPFLLALFANIQGQEEVRS